MSRAKQSVPRNRVGWVRRAHAAGHIPARSKSVAVTFDAMETVIGQLRRFELTESEALAKIMACCGRVAAAIAE